MEPAVDGDDNRARRQCQDYLLALEEERRKIEVFQRELPLCFALVTRTIESMKQQMEIGAAEEETMSGDGGAPVLEEFLPLKPTASTSTTTEDDGAAGSAADEKNKPDWLQSAQLYWTDRTAAPASSVVPCKPVAVKATRNIGAGAFQPFEKAAPAAAAPATSSTAGEPPRPTAPCKEESKENHSETANNKDSCKDQSKAASSQKARRCWSPELHRRFLHALQQLGGSHVATPKQIRELMKVEGLTNDEVKSHLQKYRLHTRRPGAGLHSSSGGSGAGAGSVPQFVVVGGIWVQPPTDYRAQLQMSTADVAAGVPAQQLIPSTAPPPHLRRCCSTGVTAGAGPTSPATASSSSSSQAKSTTASPPG